MIDLAEYIRPGDTVVWGQACAEPRTLTRALVEADVPVRCFVGIPADSAIAGGLPAHITAVSYCGTGTNASLHRDGRLDILPVHYSQLPALLTSGALHCDVVLVQVSAPDEHGRHSLGLADDYFSAAIDSARVVLAEINHRVPFVLGARSLTAADFTAAVTTSEPLAQMPLAAVDPIADAVAEQVASIVEDGATIQCGIGSLPSAVLRALHGHRNLGLHSGILTDAAVDLIESGAADGSRKSLDRGIAIGGVLGGTERLFRYADRNPAISLRPTSYTHSLDVLARSHRMTTINSAIEVDLTGQINAETVGDRYVGAVGGAIDFIRGADASPGGVPIIALASTARGRSRIVSRLRGPVSTPRCEPIVVVTEHGVADLRGLTLSQRAERLIAIADPQFRPALDAAAGQQHLEETDR